LVMPRLCFDFAILILMLKEFTLTQKQKGWKWSCIMSFWISSQLRTSYGRSVSVYENNGRMCCKRVWGDILPKGENHYNNGL
jgi:hypothetical protein